MTELTLEQSSSAAAGCGGGTATSGRTPERPVIRTAELQSRSAFWEGLAASRRRRHWLFLGLAVAGLILAVVLTVGPFLPSFRESLASLGFDETQSLKLLAASLIYDGVVIPGLWRMVVGLGLIERERVALDQIETRCSEYFRDLNALPFSLHQIESPFLYSGSGARAGLDRTAAYKMVENVRLDAQCRRFDPVTLVVDRVLSSVTSHSLRLRDAQQLAVRLGILGTFCGIVFALSHVGGIVQTGEVENASIQSSMNQIVRLLGIAFATSIAGLAAAILLQIAAGAMRDLELNLVELLERQAARVQAICRRAAEDTPLGADIAALRDVLDEHVQFMRRQEKDMIAISSRFGDALGRTENILAQPISALEQTGRRLGELLDAQGTAITGLERMTMTVGNLEGRVAAHFEDSVLRSADAQSAALHDMAEVLRQSHNRLMEEIRRGWGRDAGDRFEGLVDSRMGALAQQLGSAAQGQYRAMIRIAGYLAIAMACSCGALILMAIRAAGGFAWVFARLTSG